jgi:hypothetical protein
MPFNKISRMSDRRYSDDEVSAIFARATEVQHALPRQLPSSEGMSLTQLQEIGREAGIAPELVAQAARELEQPAPPQMPHFLGIPLGVARTVELDHKMSDQEWDHLVVQLRETFEARGNILVQGSFRTWTNGNLQVLVEPSGENHRVRFRTIRGEARGLIAAGLSMLGLGAMLAVITTLTPGVDPDAMSGMLTLALMGAGVAGAGVVRLPGWARKRREQMDMLASNLLRKE